MIAGKLESRCEEDVAKVRGEMEALRDAELNPKEELRLLFLRSIATETAHYYGMFGSGHLSEDAYRQLCHVLGTLGESIRHDGLLPGRDLELPPPSLIQRALAGLASVLRMTRFEETLREQRIAQEYEQCWARYRGALGVLEQLAEIAEANSAPESVIEHVRSNYVAWRDQSRAHLDQITEQFPEFVADMQERVGGRLVVQAEREAIERETHAGSIPHGVAEEMLHDLAAEIQQLRGAATGKLRLDPKELLREVPFFAAVDDAEFETIAQQLRQRTVPSGTLIMRQGDVGDSLFIIGRGVVRVTRLEVGQERDLATLMAATCSVKWPCCTASRAPPRSAGSLPVPSTN